MPDPSPAQSGSLWLQLLLLIVLILCNAFFADSEIAIITLNDNKIRKMAEEGHKKARQVLKLTADSSNFLATIQIGVTLAGFLTSATAAQSLAGPLANWFVGLVPALEPHVAVIQNVSVVVVTILMSYFSLVFGELVPKRIAMQQAEALYRAFGRATGKSPMKQYILSSDPLFERCYSRPADKRRKLYNGMIKCELHMIYTHSKHSSAKKRENGSK